MTKKNYKLKKKLIYQITKQQKYIKETMRIKSNLKFLLNYKKKSYWTITKR